jgi:type 1 fimbria pilin
MRGILVLIGLIAIAVVVLMSVGMLNITMQQGASIPTVTFNAQGGHLPKFKAETGSVGIGSTNTTVELPTVEMKNTTVTLPTIEVQQAPGASPTPAAK